MTDTYILDDQHRPIKADLMTWARWTEDGDNRLVAETFTELFRVSTVFLGLDHNFGKGPPLLFETMVFDREGHTSPLFPSLLIHDDLAGEQWRYATWDDALAGHEATVRRVRRMEVEARLDPAIMARVKRSLKGNT